MGNQKPRIGVVSEDGKIIWKTGNKIPWWEKISILQVLQAVFGVATLASLSLGMMFFYAKEWHASTVILLIAFFSMFVLWEIEYCKNNYHESKRAFEEERCQ